MNFAPVNSQSSAQRLRLKEDTLMCGGLKSLGTFRSGERDMDSFDKYVLNGFLFREGIIFGTCLWGLVILLTVKFFSEG